MGLFDALKKKPEEQLGGQKSESAESSESESSGKFNEVCALCGKQPTEVKWMGQFWHKRCKRSGKKFAKRMM